MQRKILLWRGTRVPHPFTTNRRMKERAPSGGFRGGALGAYAPPAESMVIIS